MVSITERQLFEYQMCPLHYDAIYNKHIAATNNTSLSQLLKKVESFFFLKLMNGTAPPLSALKKEWDGLCEKYDIAPKKALEGLQLLSNLYSWAEDKELMIAADKEPFKIVIHGRHDDIELSGQLGTIAKTKDKPLCLMDVSYSSKYPDQAAIDMRLKYTIDAFVFNKLYEKDLKGILVHHARSAKDFVTSRMEESNQRLVASIDNVAWSIKNNVYYPRETAFCSSCDMKLYCLAWRG